MKSLNDIYATCNFYVVEPESFKEISKEDVWERAMQEEIEMIEKNKTWVLIDKPKDKR